MEGNKKPDKIFKTKLFNDNNETKVDFDATQKQKFYANQKQNHSCSNIDMQYTKPIQTQQKIKQLQYNQYLNFQELKRLQKAYQIRQDELQKWTDKEKRLQFLISQKYVCPKKLNDFFTNIIMTEFKLKVKKTLEVKQKQIDELKSCMKSQIDQIKDTKNHYNNLIEQQKQQFQDQLEIQTQNIQNNHQQTQNFNNNKYIQEIETLKSIQKQYQTEIELIEISYNKKQSILLEQKEKNKRNFQADKLNFSNEQKNKNEKEIDILKNQYNQQIFQLEEQIKILEIKNNSIKEQCAKIIDDSEDCFQQLKEQIEKSNTQVYNSVVTQKVDQANQNLLKKIEQNQNLENKIEELENQIKNINQSKQNKNDNLEKYIENELASFKNKNQQKLKEIELLQKDIKNKEIQFNQVIEKIDKDFEDFQLYEEDHVVSEQQKCTLNNLEILEHKNKKIGEEKQKILKRIDLMQRLQYIQDEDLPYFYDQIKSKDFQIQFSFQN